MKSLEERIWEAKKLLDEADVIVIGAGSGLSTAAGINFGGERFEKYCHDFGEKFGYHDMYSGYFYPYEKPEQFWALVAKTILVNRYDIEAMPLYKKLYEIMHERNYFVVTTNTESQFVKAGFPEKKVFEVQGDYQWFQCSRACHDKLYYNEEQVREMVAKTVDCAIPHELLPVCPVCGEPMAPNLRADEYFVEDKAWHEMRNRYEDFIGSIGDQNVVYLEFGIGPNTPAVIRYPFERWTYQNPNAHLIRFNRDYPEGNPENRDKTIAFTEDVNEVLESMYSD